MKKLALISILFLSLSCSWEFSPSRSQYSDPVSIMQQFKALDALCWHVRIEKNVHLGRDYYVWMCRIMMDGETAHRSFTFHGRSFEEVVDKALKKAIEIRRQGSEMPNK